MTLPTTIHHIQDNTYEMILVEGRFHQIKKMMHAVHHEVLSLHRTQIGPIHLEAQLLPGTFRPLTKEEVQSLLQHWL
jgi:16S rRNA pseudouridine516 synthase